MNNLLKIASDIRGSEQSVLSDVIAENPSLKSDWFLALPDSIKVAWPRLSDDARLTAYAVSCHLSPWLDASD